jgi:hypothetical protein
MTMRFLLPVCGVFFVFFTADLFGQQDSLQRFKEPDIQAKQAVANIIRFTGLTPNFTVHPGDVKTAAAYIRGGQRYIVYSTDFISRLTVNSKTDWAALSVLAHEIGHHLLGHTLKGYVGNPGDELAADRFSGFILSQMGSSLAEAQAALKTVGNEIDTILHPPVRARMEAVKLGWEEASNLKSKKVEDFYLAADSATYKNKLIWKIRFSDDPNSYFVDSENLVIWFDNYGMPIQLGVRSVLKEGDYNWEYQYQGRSFGVDSKGNIWGETTYGFKYIVGKAELMDKL